MKGYTIQNSIELLEKAVENGSGSGGASTAADVSYDNTSSHLTADDVQEAIDEINAKIPTSADDISYDNTSSGLTADDVQEAIDELAGIKPINIGSTETQIGTYNGDPLYVKSFSESVTISTPISTNLYGGDVVDLFPVDANHCLDVLGIMGGHIISNQSAYADGHWTTSLYSIYALTSVSLSGFLLYTKAAPVSKKKKGGK